MWKHSHVTWEGKFVEGCCMNVLLSHILPINVMWLGSKAVVYGLGAIVSDKTKPSRTSGCPISHHDSIHNDTPLAKIFLQRFNLSAEVEASNKHFAVLLWVGDCKGCVCVCARVCERQRRSKAGCIHISYLERLNCQQERCQKKKILCVSSHKP